MNYKSILLPAAIACLCIPATGQDLLTMRFASKATDVATNWCARTQRAFGWNGSQWVLDETYSFGYNSKGQVMTQSVTDSDGSITRQQNTWNANGMLASRITSFARKSGASFSQTQRLTREYDERLTSFITLNDQKINQGGSWYPSNSYTQTITRNDDGNITLMERAVWFQGIYDPIFRLHVAYGEDGKATEISTEDLQYDGLKQEYWWKVGTTYKDIKWERTDGQIVSVEDLYSGENRIASATAIIGGQEYKIRAEYSEDGSWHAYSSQFDPDVDLDLVEEMEFIPLDDNGSSRLINTISYVEDDNSIGAERRIMTYMYDDNGLILLEETLYDNGDATEIVQKTEGTVVYDETHGYPLSWTIQEYEPETGEMVNAFFAQFDDYVDLNSALTEVSAEGSAGYFNLLGQPVANPQKGQILLRHTAKGTEKIKF